MSNEIMKHTIRKDTAQACLSCCLMEILNIEHMPFGCLKLVCLGNQRCCNRYFHVYWQAFSLCLSLQKDISTSPHTATRGELPDPPDAYVQKVQESCFQMAKILNVSMLSM
jgi:hypothetical protein